MVAVAYVNGRICSQQDALISVFDHGFLFGEGVYEVIRTYDGEPFLLDRHLRRLRTSAGMLALKVATTDAEFEANIRSTMSALEAAPGAIRSDYYIRIVLTRGVGDMTYDPAASPAPTTVIILRPLAPSPPEIYEKGVTIALVPIVRNHPGTVSPLIKSNNLLNNAMAMQEAMRRGAFEGLMRNYRGELAECAQSNIFIVRHGELMTPPLTAGILSGITREFILEFAQAIGIPGHETMLHDEDLFTADEAFLSVTTREIIPVVRVDDRVIGNGQPGPITHMLLVEFRRRARELAHRRSV
jgi:branched-chain amino acid aminotransferase